MTLKENVDEYLNVRKINTASRRKEPSSMMWELPSIKKGIRTLVGANGEGKSTSWISWQGGAAEAKEKISGLKMELPRTNIPIANQEWRFAMSFKKLSDLFVAKARINEL